MIIGLIFILAGILVLIEAFIYTRKKNKLEDVKLADKASIKKEKKKLSNLWGINKIDNQLITSNNNQHSIIVELDSIEYSLLHSEEKESVDRELISIAQMLKFPIQFLEIKKQIELGDIMDEILINTLNANENLKQYGNEIIKHLEKLFNNFEKEY